MSHKKGVALFGIVILAGLMIGSILFSFAPAAYAADGSGTNTVTPTSTNISTTGNTFTFTFTAAETMNSGEMEMTSPSGWSMAQGTNGTAGYTTVSTTGTIADVEDTADSATGWNQTGGACGSTAPTADTGVKHEGTASVVCPNGNVGAGDIWYHNISAQNWSAYTKVGFWIRSNSAIVAGNLQFSYDNTASLASPLESLSVGAISANTWTYVVLNFGATTRTSILSYGLRVNSGGGIDNHTIYIDDILLGPGSPTFPGGGVINTRILQLASSGTITTTYGAGGGASGVTAPATAGIYTATTTSRFNDSGTLTNLASQPTLTAKNPTPTLTSISPTLTTAGGGNFVLTANGSSFVNGITINFDGTPLTTTFVSSSQATTTITAAQIAVGGTHSITVTNPTPGGGTSGAQTLTVNNPIPTITAISPISTLTNTAPTLTITGTGFNANTTAMFNGSSKTPTVASSTQLTITLNTTDTASGGTSTIVVTNPTPGGGSTTSTAFAVLNRVPSITNLLPSTAIAGASGATSTITGTGFVNGSIVNWNGSSRTTVFASSTQLSAFFTTSDFLTATTSTITVTNPTPGGGTSTTTQTFTVLNPSPTTVSVSPTSTFVGDATTTITITGTGFNAQSVARYNGSNRTTTFVSATTVQMTLLSTDLATANDTALITIFNPTPGGGTSNAQTFSVRYRIPTLTSIFPVSATVGDPGFTISATGTGFVSGATVLQFASSARSTTVTSSTTLTASILASDLTAAGAFNITVFNPTPGGGTSTAQTFTVNKANITIALGSSLNPSTYGSSVIFTATTTGPIGTPTGTVTFKNGGVAFATSTISNGVATAATSTLGAGTHSFTATYNSDSNFNASTSAALSQVVNQAAVTITLASSLNPSAYGESVTFTATTTSGVGMPSGTVTFKDAGVAFATSTLSGGVATAATSTLSIGAHSITATYNSDTNFAASTSAAVSQVVNQANVTITLGSSLNPSIYGGAVTFTATTTGGLGTPTGTVTFKNGGVAFATSILSGGIATISTSTLTVGTHLITATYNGDTNYNASTSATVSQVVNKANITITIGSSLNPSTYGDMVIFTATTTATAGTPIGTVTFKDAGVAFATSTLSGGIATISTSTLTVGTHTITATYNGDTNFNASTSASVSQVVNKTNITITLGSSLNPSTYGDSVIFTATTTAIAGTPTGTVTFKDGGVAFAISTLSGGVATIATSTLSTGTHTITATYNGDSNFNASTSAAVSQVVNNPVPVITVLSPDTTEEGSATTTLTINGSRFAANASVTFDGTPLSITSSSSSTINTNIPASLLTAFGTSTVAVTNPTPGGGTATSSFIITRSAVRFVIIDPTDGTVDAPITVTVVAQKANGATSSNYQSDVTLNTSGSATPTSTLINIINGIGTTNISDTVAETVTLSLTDSQATGLDVSSTQQVVFAHGAAAKFTLAGPATLDVGNRAAFTVTRKDQFNNLVTTGPNTTAYFYTTSTSTSAKFYNAETDGTVVTSAVMSTGTSTATVWYYDEEPGVYTITASDNGTTPDGNTGIDDATSTLTVRAVATRFVIIDPVDGTVDAPITVTVRAQDNLGHIDTNYQGDVTLIATSTSGHASTTNNGLVDIINGVGTINVSDIVAETVHLSLSDTQSTGLNVSSSTQDVVFAPGAVAKFALSNITDTPQDTRLRIDVIRRDQFNNAVMASSTTVYFYTSPTTTANKFFNAPTGGTQTNIVTLGNGTASSSIWFGGSPLGTLGTFTITASDNATAPDGNTGIDDAATTTTITPVATQLIIFDPTDGTVDAPITVNVEARDDNNNLVTSYNGSASLAVTGHATLDSAGTITFADGRATTTLRDTVAPEAVTISIVASSTALRATSTQSVSIGVGALSQFSLTDPGDVTAGTLAGYTATRKDQYGNLVTSGTITPSLLVSPTTTPGTFYASNSTSSLALTTLQFDNGNSTAQFWYYNEVAGTYQLTVQNGSVVGNDLITINPAAVSKLTINDRVSTNPGSRLQYTIGRKDAFNNAVTSGLLTVYLYASPSSTSTAFYDAASGGNVVNSITINDTQSSANAWYYETQTGTYTVTASDNATAPDGVVGLLDATDSVSVQTATATRFVFASVTPQTLATGNSSVVTIEARDNFGNLDTNYQNDVTLVTGVSSVFGTGLSSGQALIDIVNGIGSITLTDNIAEMVNLALSDSQGTGLIVSAVSSITWNPGPTAQFVVNDPGDIVAGNRIGYAVSRKDQYGNYVTSGSDTIYLYSDSLSTNKAFYISSTTPSTVQFVTITAGATTTHFWYSDDTAGTYTITASDNATAPDGTVGIDDGTDQLIVAAAPIVATRYVILDPQDVAVGQSTVVVIQTQNDAGALDNTQQEDIVLVFSTSSVVTVPGMVNNAVQVNIIDGIGTVTVTDSVIETVALSLRRITGSTSALGIASTQNIAFSAALQAVAGGGGGFITPTPTASFTGRAYPGAKVSLFARVAGRDIPLERDIKVNADGTFTIDFSGALRGLESFGLAILDKDGKVAQIKTYDMNKVTKVTAEKNLYIAPTVGVVQRTVTTGNNVGISGSAAPGSTIKAEIDGKPVETETKVGKDGTYRLLINTKDLAYGGHVVRTRQVDKNGVESDYSPLKVFTVSRALVTRADLNNNGGIDIGDWSIFLTRFASTDPESRKQVDLNDDGKVDISDFSIFIRSTVGR